MLDFRFKDYKCKYFIGDQLIQGVCFSHGCGVGKYGEKQKHTHITYTWTKKQDQLNYCFLDVDTMLAYFMDIAKILGFKLISFSENDTGYKLQIDVVANRRYFIYVSTYIRYVYEFPFSFILYCALQNKNHFPELNVTHIMQFYLAIFHDNTRCHCPGEPQLAYRNINSKCQFNLIRSNFNLSKSFVEVPSTHNCLFHVFGVVNEKNLSALTNYVNTIINQYYDKHKKSICCW